MRSGLCCILVLLVVASSGCRESTYIVNEPQYIPVHIDPNSANTFIMAVMPAVNRIDECQIRLITQMGWLSRNLDKCLEKLEAERGLEPIPKKADYLKGDPNFTLPLKRWYEPYEPQSWQPMETPQDVRILLSWFYSGPISECEKAHGLDDWIENFEHRMKRLERHPVESNDANSATAEK